MLPPHLECHHVWWSAHRSYWQKLFRNRISPGTPTWHSVRELTGFTDDHVFGDGDEGHGQTTFIHRRLTVFHYLLMRYPLMIAFAYKYPSQHAIFFTDRVLELTRILESGEGIGNGLAISEKWREGAPRDMRPVQVGGNDHARHRMSAICYVTKLPRAAVGNFERAVSMATKIHGFAKTNEHAT